MCGKMEWARGEVITPKGSVEVSWRKMKDKIELEVKAPKGIEIQKLY